MVFHFHQAEENKVWLIGSDCTSMHCGARDAKPPQQAGWCHPSALQHEAESVCMRCSLLMTLSSFLMLLSSCSLSVPCNNESFESGNILGCVRQCKYKWKWASEFILTGTISCEGVYCWFLFLCILAVTLLLCCAVVVGLHGLSFWVPQFWSDCGERLAKKHLLEDPWFLRIAGVKDGLNEWNLVLKLHQSVYGTAASLPLPLPPFKSIPSSMLVPEAVAGCLVHACLQSPFSLSYRPGFCYLHCAPCPSPAVLVPRGT